MVGQRVVVRRVLRGETGPTGGPALTDLLGVCTAWGSGVCVLQPETGSAVTIALADIVSGKPVPPRPSIRHRVSARNAESHTAALWEPVERFALGAWELRFDPGPAERIVKRSNSVLAMGDPGVPVGDALAEVVAFYAARDRQPLAQVEVGSDLEDAVAAAGWRPLGHGDSDFLLASVAQVRRALPAPGPLRIELDGDGPRAVARVRADDDALVASARAGRDGDWVGLHGLEVAAGQRRRGLGTALVFWLLEWAAEQGAMTAWLHVETDNAAGLAFWSAAGFAPHHSCRYYAPPTT